MDEQDIKNLIEGAINDASAFSVPKYGDTPSDAKQLTPKGYVDKADNAIISSVISLQASVAGFTNPNFFGDGSDGDVTISSGTTTLTSDKYYNSLTLSGTGILKTNGYQIFVKSTTAISGSAHIDVSGNDGSNGSNGTTAGTNASGGAGGTALSAGTLAGGRAGVDGGIGGAAKSGNNAGEAGGVGADAVSFSVSIGASGGAGATNNTGLGGPSDNFGPTAGGVGGAAGTVTPAVNLPHSLISCLVHADLLSAYAQHKGSATSGGSGGGGGGTSSGIGTSGGGGAGAGGGSTGGIIAIYSQIITNSVTGGIRANGGNGGVGGTGANAITGSKQGGGGGGAGGNGGTGGVIIAVYKTLNQTGSFTVSGGTGGAGGSGGTGTNGGGSAGGPGVTAADGLAGKIWLYQV